MGYGVILNPNSKKLLIFLDGGGACFNPLTCSKNRDHFSEEDFLERVASDPSLLINRSSDQNQFKDWNLVFVPYATGDVHSGTNSSGKGLGNGKFHRVTSGHSNIDFALAKLYRITNGIAANIGNARPFANQRQLGWRFMHTLLHNRG